MVFNSLINRIITSFTLILLFGFILIFYDTYLKFLVYLIYTIIFLELIIYIRKNMYFFLISIIYLFISLICFELYFRNFYIKEEFLFTIMLVIVFDIASYAFGTKFGILKILPAVSPNKTFIGLISGFITAFILGFSTNYYYKIFETVLLIYFIFFTLISAFIGDIVESIIKRKCNLKNSSNFLPGHGGFFDRFDSLIMVFIWLFSFNLII